MTVFCPHCGKELRVSPEDLGNMAGHEHVEAECPYCGGTLLLEASLLLQKKSKLIQTKNTKPFRSKVDPACHSADLQPQVQKRKLSLVGKILICVIGGTIFVGAAIGISGEIKSARLRKQLAELEQNMVPIPGENFSMCKYEVTQALWQSVMGNNPSKHKGANLPVENVSYKDCEAFVEKLNEEAPLYGFYSPHRYMIPTKWQWEIASAGGIDNDKEEWGFCKLADGTLITIDDLDKVAWYAANSMIRGKHQTHPVGQKMPNAFGLYDMFGNVSEWINESRQGNWEDKPWGKLYFGGSYRDIAKECYETRIFLAKDSCGDRGLRLVRRRFFE